MKDLFFKIRGNIQDFVKRETEGCGEFSFIISEKAPDEFSDAGFNTSHWLVKSKNLKALQEFKLELEKKFSNLRGYIETNHQIENSAEYLYLLIS